METDSIPFRALSNLIRQSKLSMISRSYAIVWLVPLVPPVAFWLAVGLRGLVFRKPFLIDSRWFVGALVPGLGAIMLKAFDSALQSPSDAGLANSGGLLLVILLVVLFKLWIMMKGYTAYGVTDVSFREALFYALKKLNIPFEEILWCVKLPLHSTELEVSIHSRVGEGHIRLRHSSDKKLLLAIKDEMNSYFRTTNIKMNMSTCILFVITGALCAVLAIALSFR